jgi:chromosome segregation ATPase
MNGPAMSNMASSLIAEFGELIEDFHYMLNNQDDYLTEHVESLKTLIQTRSETISQTIKQAAKEMMNQMDSYLVECNNNRSNLTQVVQSHGKELAKLKQEASSRKKELKAAKEDTVKLAKLMEQVQVSLQESKRKKAKFEDDLKMNKTCVLDQVFFGEDRDLLGRLYINDKEITPDSDEIVKKKLDSSKTVGLFFF